MNPEGWQEDTPLSQDERNLQRFLDDLQRKCQDALAHSEEMRRTWHEALKDAAWQRVPAKCPACSGTGRTTEIAPSAVGIATARSWNMSCLWCEGSGAVQIVPERRGVA